MSSFLCFIPKLPENDRKGFFKKHLPASINKTGKKKEPRVSEAKKAKFVW